MPVLIFLSLFATLSLFAAETKPKGTCHAKELKRQDCRLSAKSYELRLLGKTVAWTDGTWHSVDPMPLFGEGVVWEKVNFAFLNHQPILQVWLWDKGVGEAQVQSLHWYVMAAEKRRFQILSDGVVRRRHQKEKVDVPVDAVPPTKTAESSAPVKKPQFIYDKMETHSLKALKSGELEWSLGAQKRKLQLGDSHGI